MCVGELSKCARPPREASPHTRYPFRIRTSNCTQSPALGWKVQAELSRKDGCNVTLCLETSTQLRGARGPDGCLIEKAGASLADVLMRNNLLHERPISMWPCRGLDSHSRKTFFCATPVAQRHSLVMCTRTCKMHCHLAPRLVGSKEG